MGLGPFPDVSLADARLKANRHIIAQQRHRPAACCRTLWSEGSLPGGTQGPTAAGSVSAAPPPRHAACPPEGLPDWSAAHVSAVATGEPATHHVGATAFPARRERSFAPGARKLARLSRRRWHQVEDGRIGVAIGVGDIGSGKMQVYTPHGLCSRLVARGRRWLRVDQSRLRTPAHARDCRRPESRVSAPPQDESRGMYAMQLFIWSVGCRASQKLTSRYSKFGL